MISPYLSRIQYRGELNPGLQTLARLQETHLYHVPFENLDIHNHIPIDLQHLFDKIVIRRRGGFCYELNELFFQLLREIGFTVKRVSARVWGGEKGFGPEFDHLAIIATIDGKDYLTDVGFGEFALHPLPVEGGTEINDPRGVFIIEPYDETYKVVKKKNAEGNFDPEYIFSEQARNLEEFYGMCLYHQTSPASHFTQKRICSLPGPGGRVSLTGNSLKITEGGKMTEKELKEEEVMTVLRDYFGVLI